MKARNIIIPLVLLLIVMSACSTVDCAMDAGVLLKAEIYQGDDEGCADTITMRMHRAATYGDTVIINKQVDATALSWQLSYDTDVDSVFVELVNISGEKFIDTLLIGKTNIPAFEDVDCKPRYLHEIKKVDCKHHIIKKVEIINANVNHDATENIAIYFDNTSE